MGVKQGAFANEYSREIYVLPRKISAIQIIPEENGRVRLGAIAQLPEGAEVAGCGEGFNERTTKVCWEGQFYYIFREDVEPVRSHSAHAYAIA